MEMLLSVVDPRRLSSMLMRTANNLSNPTLVFMWLPNLRFPSF